MGLNRGYKQTEVGVIPEDWQTPTLGSLTALMTNGFVGTATTHYANNEKGILYIQGYNIEANSFNFHGIKFVTEDFHKAHMKSCLRAGDLLTVQTGEVGLTSIVPESLAGSNCHALIISRFNERKVSSAFISYYLNSKPGRSRLKLIETGTTMKHLNVGDMLQFVIPLPPTKAEQDAIAQVLRDADALIESLEQLIVKKRHIKHGALQELLTGRRRVPGFKGRWETKRLSDVAALNKLNVLPSSQPDQVFVHFSLPAFDDGRVPVFEAGSAIGSHKFRIPQEAILVSKLNPRIPRVWAPDIIPDDAIASTEFLVLTPREGVLRGFLFVICSAPSFCEQMELAATGTTGSHQRISPSGALSLGVSVPIDIEEQAAIVTTLTDMDDEIAALEMKLAKIREIRKGMMQELLTGKVRLV